MMRPQVNAVVEDPASVIAAIESRFSCRAFSPDKPVSREQVDELLRIASFAASSTNTQPEGVWAAGGSSRCTGCASVCRAR